MVDFVKSAKTAKRLIDKNGRTVVFVKKSSIPNNEAKPWLGSKDTEVTFSTKCAFIDYEIREVDGDQIKIGDKKLLANAIDNGTNIVEDFDTVRDGITSWRIKSVKPLQPADTIVMYEIQVRK